MRCDGFYLENIMKKYKKWLFLAVILTFIWGCKKNSTTNEYFPHKDGNQWKYKSTERTGYFIREFSGTTRYNETTFQNWVKTDFDTAGNQLSTDTNYIIANDSLISFFEFLDEDPYILLKLPLIVDSTWTFYIDEEPINVLVETKEDDFSVEAGTYDNVFVVRYDDPDNEEVRRVYYSPGVGIVKDVSADYDGDLVYDEELIKYPAND